MAKLCTLCYVMYATLCMLRYVCYVMYATLCMLRYVCYVMYATLCMLIFIILIMYHRMCTDRDIVLHDVYISRDEGIFMTLLVLITLYRDAINLIFICN